MSEQRTEQATPRRLEKAREKGQFPTAKELVGGLQFFVLVLILTRCAEGWFGNAQLGFRSYLALAFRREWSVPDLMQLARSLVIATFLPVAAAAGIIAGLTLAFQLGTTNMGVSLSKLTPDFSRLNPLPRLRDIPRQNVPAALQALILLVVLSLIALMIAREYLPMLLLLPLSPARAGIGEIAHATSSVLWRAALLLMAFGAIEGFRQRSIFNKSLRMTKQEIREEHKESDGDPHVKARIRKLRRDLLRRRMMQDVPTATAVIVNPTHYAVAIRYDSTGMASPKVVAKGRDHLAARIRQLATENGVTIVENPPLARALYGSVDVGQEIPPDFYRAVAEVLAWVYRVSGMRTPGQN